MFFYKLLYIYMSDLKLHYRENHYKVDMMHHKNEFRNKLHNGSMRVAQRGTTFNVPLANPVNNNNPPYYTFDRWHAISTVANKLVITQGNKNSSPAPPAEFTNYMKITSPLDEFNMSPTDLFTIGQYVEYKNYNDMYNGQPQARVGYLTFWIHSPVTGTFGGAISNYSTDGDAVFPFKYTIPRANTWEQIRIKINPCKLGTWTENTYLDVYLNFGCGVQRTNDKSNQWINYNGSNFPFTASGVDSIIATGRSICVTGIQFEQNNTPTFYQHLPYNLELFLCQYYYQRINFEEGDLPLFMTRTNQTEGGLNDNRTYGYVPFVTNMRDAPSIEFSSNSWVISALSAQGFVNSGALTTNYTDKGASLENRTVALDGDLTTRVQNGYSDIQSLNGSLNSTALTLNTTMGAHYANIANVNAKTDKFTIKLTNDSAQIINNILGFCVVWTPLYSISANVSAELYPVSSLIRSRDIIIDGGFVIGETTTKDMTNDDYTYEFDPNIYPEFFPGMASLITTNIVAGDKSEGNRLIASYWDDWGNDVFDNWGYFYLYDVESGKYYFPIFNPQNRPDGEFNTQTFEVFGRTFTIKHGWCVQGIFKFEILASGNKPFRFGCYGNMGTDEYQELTHSYTLNGNNQTLYYIRNDDGGQQLDTLYSYWIPKKVDENATKTYEFYNGPAEINEDDENNMMSKEVTKGMIVYFSKSNDVKEWVVNDLTL